MSTRRHLFSRLRALVIRSRFEDEMDQELRFHLERQIEDNVKAGMSPQEGRCAALRAFGGVEQVKEQCLAIHAASGSSTSSAGTFAMEHAYC